MRCLIVGRDGDRAYSLERSLARWGAITACSGAPGGEVPLLATREWDLLVVVVDAAAPGWEGGLALAEQRGETPAILVESFLQSLGLALLLIGLVMLASFKSLKLGLISVIPNIVPLVFGGAVLYFLSGRLDIGTVMVASVSLGIAVDNTIHILSNFNRHVAEGYSPRESLSMLMAHAGPAMVSTTFILVAGFLTLALGTFIPNVYFGLMTATILSIGLLADFVLLPALLLTPMKAPAKETGVSVAVAVGDETQAAE
ncbi:MAG: hypothetical protein FJ034_08850 [Chloroflexi bacterium]|nr:hypothetical protein [Chloroflexota bacterium]